MGDSFADRLIRRVREIGHPLCVGLDPHLSLVPASFRRGTMAPGAPETAEAVEAFCLAALDRVVGRVAVVKPQSAFFEQLGPPGAAVLGRVVAEARARDLLVILDAKRGDIGSTAEGYARAYLAKDAPLRADALTVNPWLGLDTLEPFVQTAEASGAGLFVLVKTSNPGSGDLQDRLVGERRVWELLADELAPLAARLRGPATEWSSLGVVVGATYPEESERVRELLPSSPFLVPGYGAQGGGVTAALAGFVPGPGGRLEGGLVNSARAILFPDGGEAGGRAWEEAFDAALARAADELGRAAG